MKYSVWLLLLMVALWATDALMGAGVFWEHDLRHQHIPWRVWAATEWTAGRIPLWNPDVGNGFALAGDGQTGVFYLPTMLLFAWLPAALAVNLAILGHIAWAAEGTRRLMRHLGVTGPGTLLAAVAFAFSGFMTTHAGYLGMQNAAAWLPWLIGATVAGRWAPIGLCSAMIMVAGHPQVASMGLLGAFAIAMWKRNVRAFGVGILLGTVAASPQIFATWDLIQDSVRAGGVSTDFATIGALPIQELISTIQPSFFGYERPADMLQSYVQRGGHYWGGGVSHWDSAVYLGVPVCVMALVGARSQRFWVGVAIASVLLMIASPLWGLLRLLPVFDSMRYPVRFSLWLTLATSVLAGFGLQAVLKHPTPGRLSARVMGLVGVVIVTLTVAAQIFHAIRNELKASLTARYAGRSEWSVEAQAERVQQILEGMGQAVSLSSTGNVTLVCLLLLMAGLLFLQAKHFVPASWVAVGIVVVAYVDFWSFGHDYNERTPRAVMEQTPIPISTLGNQIVDGRIAVVDRHRHPDKDKDLISANMGLQYGLSDVVVPSPLRNRRNDALLQKVGIDVGVRAEDKWTRVMNNAHLLNMLGVRWVLSEHPQPDARLKMHMESPVHVYENTDAMPLAFLVGCVERTDEPWSALDTLHPEVWAITEEDVGLPACQAALSGGSVEVIRAVADHREMHVESPAEALLVWTETHAPGWTVSVNGNEGTIHRVNWNFRGVRVPTGSSTVEWRYEPIWLGAALPLASVSWLSLLLGLRRWRDVGE